MTEITHILNNVGRHGQSESPLPQDGTSDESARFDDSRQMYTHDQHAYDGQDTFCEQQSCSGLYGFDPQNMTTYHQCMSLPAAQQRRALLKAAHAVLDAIDGRGRRRVWATWALYAE